VALCHLQQGSVGVEQGRRVEAGEVVGRCGNSGNSTEPHLHLQALSGSDVTSASAVPFTVRGGLPRNGEVVRAN
ncbi:MAG TPA: M23 family metallopeptidase, partial [Propionibacteriaceae bacterium]|nr:M23 family metallopeptidase [Propionibacteriaceae bacterium]